MLALNHFLRLSAQTRRPERPLHVLSDCATAVMPDHMHVGQTMVRVRLKTRGKKRSHFCFFFFFFRYLFFLPTVFFFFFFLKTRPLFLISLLLMAPLVVHEVAREVRCYHPPGKAGEQLLRFFFEECSISHRTDVICFFWGRGAPLGRLNVSIFLPLLIVCFCTSNDTDRRMA